jgi:hypothetical protein
MRSTLDSRQREEDFSYNLCVQTCSKAHPASSPMGTGGPFTGGKARQGRDVDHSPHLVPRSWMSRSYTSSRPCASIVVLWDCFTFLPLHLFRNSFFLATQDSTNTRHFLKFLQLVCSCIWTAFGFQVAEFDLKNDRSDNLFEVGLMHLRRWEKNVLLHKKYS